jgi:minor extracellular protease Epr
MSYDISFPDDKILEIGDINLLSEVIDWGLIDFSVPDLWKYNKGDNITILVADSGMSKHIDLNDNILFDKSISCVEGEDLEDISGHGTMVGGVIAAKDSGYGIVGVAPNAKIIAVKVFKNGHIGDEKAIEKMLRYACQIKPDIVNLSFGGPRKLTERCEFYINTLVNEFNIPVVCAMGNYGANYSCFPAEYPSTFGVTSYNKERLISSFSSRSSNADFALPGENILTTSLNNQYAIVNGTSFASPFLCGIIAIILSHAKKINKIFTVSKIKNLLINSSKDYGPSGKDSLYGYGIINSTCLLNLIKYNFAQTHKFNSLNIQKLLEQI